jgi:hypothetical protein
VWWWVVEPLDSKATAMNAKWPVSGAKIRRRGLSKTPLALKRGAGISFPFAPSTTQKPTKIKVEQK